MQAQREESPRSKPLSDEPFRGTPPGNMRRVWWQVSWLTDKRSALPSQNFFNQFQWLISTKLAANSCGGSYGIARIITNSPYSRFNPSSEGTINTKTLS